MSTFKHGPGCEDRIKHGDGCYCEERAILALFRTIEEAQKAKAMSSGDGRFDDVVSMLGVWLDRHYWPETFNGSSGDPGAVFVVAVRAAVAALREKVEKNTPTAREGKE